ncbi:MAG TPA: HAMP domain-containing sensor histidine kinase [Candidatus Limnocylindria bacterium]|nr:HAMP domain-containing sensor histidine kinase [Candidatus Limnocylindria bacterium]
MDRGERRALLALTEIERAALRLRLAATALAATILVLDPGHDQVTAGSLLLGYAAGALVLRKAGSALPLAGWIGVGVDVLFATALAHLLPLSGAWVLYLFPIGTAALRGGVAAIAATAAASVATYDLVLAARGGDALATDLWPIQVLLAFAVVAAELVWVVMRSRDERRELRTYSLAQRDLAAARDADELLGRLTDHAVRSFGASGAWIEGGATAHGRGLVDDPAARASALPLGGDLVLRVVYDDEQRRERGLAALRDLVTDSGPVLATVTALARIRIEHDADRRALDAVRQLSDETTSAGALARGITTAQSVFGTSAVVRVATGERLVGDLDPDVASELARDNVPPRLVREPATTAAVVGAGPGLVLVSLGTRRPLIETDLDVLRTLGDAIATALARIGERETLIASATELRHRSDELERGLRERDDAVTSAVHELRNPLTSVQAYGQLMTRHLAAVQRQVTQLDSLIEDLLRVPTGAPPRALALERADLAREVSDAAARLRVAVPGRDVRIAAEPGPHEAFVDPSRFAQVLDNVLRNAAKYSPAGDPIDVRLSRAADEVLIAVSDNGDGVPPDERERIFERYVRGSRHAATQPGAGLGLAVSREIVTAHGGRIWADSAGPGRGSTFTIALPAAETATVGGVSPDRAERGA